MFSGGCRVQPIVTNPSAIIIKKIFFSIWILLLLLWLWLYCLCIHSFHLPSSTAHISTSIRNQPVNELIQPRREKKTIYRNKITMIILVSTFFSFHIRRGDDDMMRSLNIFSNSSDFSYRLYFAGNVHGGRDFRLVWKILWFTFSCVGISCRQCLFLDIFNTCPRIW